MPNILPYRSSDPVRRGPRGSNYVALLTLNVLAVSLYLYGLWEEMLDGGSIPSAFACLLGILVFTIQGVITMLGVYEYTELEERCWWDPLPWLVILAPFLVAALAIVVSARE